MIERQTELKRRYHRKAKIKKLKAKLEKATGEDREKILYKIKRLSPTWTEASLKQTAHTPPTAKAERKPSAPKASKGPARKGPPADKKA
jgi:hypothetical protein